MSALSTGSSRCRAASRSRTRSKWRTWTTTATSTCCPRRHLLLRPRLPPLHRLHPRRRRRRPYRALPACCARRTACGRQSSHRLPQGFSRARCPCHRLARRGRAQRLWLCPGEIRSSLLGCGTSLCHVLTWHKDIGLSTQLSRSSPRPKSLISQYVSSPSALSLWSAPLFRH